MRMRGFLLGTLVCVLTACGEETPSPAASPEPDEVFAVAPSPAPPGSSVPGLFLLGDRPALSWVETRDDGSALRFATWEGEGWSTSRTAAEGTGWFVNWADRSGIVALEDGALVAHYLVAHGTDNPYAYDIRLTRSGDGGRTWSAPITPHRDGTPTEHGFVSAVPQEDGSLLVAWLDGRGYHPVAAVHDEEAHDPHDEMSLRVATLTADGRLMDEVQLDHRTCDCCPTAATAVPGGALVAYRDRSASEIRDIAVVRLQSGSWSAPATVHTDGWHIDGCPVNGPALAAEGAHVAVAWFTGAEDASHVRLAFSEDGGETFGSPVMVDDGRPLGRVDVAWLDDGRALVSWLEQAGEGAELRVRLVSAAEEPFPSHRVAAVDAGRETGMPRLLLADGTVFVTWTKPGERAQVRLATARIADLMQPTLPEVSAP